MLIFSILCCNGGRIVATKFLFPFAFIIVAIELRVSQQSSSQTSLAMSRHKKKTLCRNRIALSALSFVWALL